VPGSSDDARSDPATAASAGFTRRPGFVWLLAALIVPVLLTAALLVAKTGSTEDDLRDRSLAALEARGITGAEVEFDGRDATVVVPAGADASQAREVVAAVDGVRAAKSGGSNPNLADVTLPSASGTPIPSAEPTAEPVVVVAPFDLTKTADSFAVTAVVQDQAAKDSIISEVQALMPTGTTFDDKLTVNPAAGLLNPTAVSALLRALSTADGQAFVRYDGTTVTLSGQVADQATKATAGRAAATAVPGAVVANQLQVPDVPKPPISEACQTFEQRLAQLMTQNKIVFLSGTAIVNEPSRPSVLRAAALLKSCETARVEVSGHTDNLGDPSTSLPLSQQRADAVKAALVKLGVAADRIISRGFGETRPLASNSTSAGRIANRRVELRVP